MTYRTVLLIFLACVTVSAVCVAVCAVVFGPAAIRSGGIGDADQAESKINCGMTKEEVRALLGGPHEVIGVSISYGGVRGEEWLYYETWLGGGSLLKVHFGPDDRVDERYVSPN
jgi:hypothetical protein